MKKLLTFFFACCLITIYPDTQWGVHGVEIYLITTGLPASPIMSLTLTNQSQCWDAAYQKTNAYNYEILIPSAGNNLGSYSEGFNFITSQDEPQFPVFTYGLYKVTSNYTTDYFYLDYRDQKYGMNYTYDAYITYDGAVFSFGTPSTTSRPIVKGEVIQLWKFNNLVKPITNLFVDYWANSLAVTVDQYNHPQLVWGTYPEAGFSTTKYNIYRQFGGGVPHIVTTTDSNTYKWTDMSIDLNTTHLGVTDVHYFVKPGNDNGESVSSNTVTVNVQNGNLQPVKPANFTLTSSPAYHPYLSWVYTPEPDVYSNTSNGYVLEKRLGLSAGSHSWGSWSTISLPGSTNHYEDLDITKSPGSTPKMVEYRLRAYDNVYYSDYTNSLDFAYNTWAEKTKGNYNNLNITTYNLLQNFPNPFNPSTEIYYQIPSDGNVKLKVYNVMGQEVMTLVNGFKEKGMYSVSFNAGKLTSGMYIYKLEAGNYVQIKKMILTK